VCLCGALCVWPLAGGEPTPGEYPTHLVYVVVRTDHAATDHRHNLTWRAERTPDSLTYPVSALWPSEAAAHLGRAHSRDWGGRKAKTPASIKVPGSVVRL
jgi:hypothetical protein